MTKFQDKTKNSKRIIKQMNEFLPSIYIPSDQNLASEFYDRLISWINDFHKELNEEFEVGAQLVNFGQTITFHIQDIGYWNPSLIVFMGKMDNGNPVQLIQHVSQISILLIALKRQNISEPKKPIGFKTWDDFNEFAKQEEQEEE